MKKLLLLISCLSMICLSTYGINATEEDFYEYYGIDQSEFDSIQESQFDLANNAPIEPDKSSDISLLSTSGSWTWRDGVICVTDSYTSFVNHGHAGIIGPAPYYDSTIEANPGSGVTSEWGAWYNRFSPRVYQAGVRATSEQQDANAASWASWQIGKPYSLTCGLNSTSSFYCSQLVYQAYRLGAGCTLNHALPGIITPSDLLRSDNCAIIYRYE